MRDRKKCKPNHLLIEARREKNLDQKGLAEKIRVAPGSVGRWERGERFPDHVDREKLCKFFNKSNEELGLLRENYPLTSKEDSDAAPNPQYRQALSEPSNVSVKELDSTPSKDQRETASATQNPEQSPSTASISSVPTELPQRGQEPGSRRERTRPSTSNRIYRILLPIFVSVLVFGGVIGFLIFFKISNHPNTSTPSTLSTPNSTDPSEAAEELYRRATSGHPFLNDDLSSSYFNEWDTPPATDACTFALRAYHISISDSNQVQQCFSQIPKNFFSNFALQVQMTINSGEHGDGGGIIFRAQDTTSASSASYRFHIGQDGSYDLCVSCGSVGQILLQDSGSSDLTFAQGLARPNTLTVIAQGSNIYLYVNGNYIAQVNDNTFVSGKIGLFAVNYDYGDGKATTTAVTFRNIKVWKI